MKTLFLTVLVLAAAILAPGCKTVEKTPAIVPDPAEEVTSTHVSPPETRTTVHSAN